MSQKAVVSGGTGFLGRELCKNLIHAGVEVYGLVREETSGGGQPEGVESLRIPRNFSDLVAAVRAQQPDVVFHLASAGGASHLPRDIPDIIDANITLGCALMEACRQSATRFVGVGTFWQDQIRDEAVFPNSLYAATKQASEEIAAYYRYAEGVPAVILKPYDIYGPGDERGRFLQKLAQASVAGKEIEATAGEQFVSFVHVKDVVRALRLAGEPTSSLGEQPASSFGVPGPSIGTLRSTVEKLASDLGIELTVAWGSIPYRSNEVMRTAELSTLPGWRAAIELSDGFTELIKNEQRWKVRTP